MKIDKRFQLQKAVSQDATRFQLNHIYGDVYKDKTVAVATDGRIMAIVPAEFESPEDIGVLPIDAYIEARKAAPRAGAKKKARSRNYTPATPAVVSVHLNGKAEVKTKKATVIFERNAEQFTVPEWPKVVPGGEPKKTVCLNAALLMKLAQALGDDAVELGFYEFDGQSVIRVRAQSSKDEAFGLLMPMHPHAF